MSAPQIKITIGRSEATGQCVDMWLGEWPHQVAWLHRGGRVTGQLRVHDDCPPEVLQGLVGIWNLLGENPDADLTKFATHVLVVAGREPTYLKEITHV